MWTDRDRHELAVWADELQLRGDPLGELIATSLSLEQQRRAGCDEAALAGIRAQLVELERAVLEPMVGRILAKHRDLQLSWSHGMIVALRVCPDFFQHPAKRDRLPLPLVDPYRRGPTPPLVDLFRLPITRFLRTVEINNSTSNLANLHLTLSMPGVIARPWWVAYWTLPNASLRCVPVRELEAIHRPIADKLLDGDPGLRELWIAGKKVVLPWTPIGPDTRLHACEQLCRRERFDDASLTALTRALWDADLRVRMRALDVLPRLGVDAAPMIPSLLYVDATELRWSRKIRQVLDALARDPEVVSAVAHNFTIAQGRCALWLSELPLEAAREAAPRLEAMLAGPQRATDWEHKLLIEAHRRMREPAMATPRPLRRIKRWIDGTWP